MAFDIILYENASEDNRVTKALSERLTLSGTLKENTSIINPAILVQASMAVITQCNYFYIPAFGRYYFLRDVISRTANLVEIQGHVDVLSTYAAQIKGNRAVISAQENNWNLYLNDGSIRVYQKSLVGTLAFPNPLNSNFNYVLLLAGRGAGTGGGE